MSSNIVVTMAETATAMRGESRMRRMISTGGYTQLLPEDSATAASHLPLYKSLSVDECTFRIVHVITPRSRAIGEFADRLSQCFRKVKETP